MSTDKKDAKKTLDTGFEDFEEMFFSTGKVEKTKDVDATKTSSTSSEEDSEEDFGYEGAIEELQMPLDDGSDATDLFNRSDYDALLDELSLDLEDVADELSGDSSESVPVVVVSNQRQDSPTEPESLLDMRAEFAEQTLDTFEEFGEPLEMDSTEITQPRPKTVIDDPLLDVSLDDFDFEEGFEDLDEQTIDEGSDLLDALLDTEGEITTELASSIGIEDVSVTELTAAETGSITDDLNMEWATDVLQQGYRPLSDAEHVKRIRSLFLNEVQSHESGSAKSFLWAESARLSLNYLRDEVAALQYFNMANSPNEPVLSNADLRVFADVAARQGQTREFLEVLQQWAMQRDGVLAAEAWGEIAIFLQRRFGNVETALEAIERAVSHDDKDWLNGQFLCQILESSGESQALLVALQRLESLSSGYLASQQAFRQAVLCLQTVKDLEGAVVHFKRTIETAPNLSAALALLQLGEMLDDSESMHMAIQHLLSQLDERDHLLWSLRLYGLTNGAYGKEYIANSLESTNSSEAFWLYLSLLDSSDQEERKRILLEATEQQDRGDLALIWFHLSLIFELEDDQRTAEALLKTIELDPFALIAVDDYVDHLIAQESYEECVDWLCALSEDVSEQAPEVALAYLSQAAFIADSYLQDPIRAASMLSHSTVENSGLSYLAETLYLRGEHWEALIDFYKQRAEKSEEPSEKAHWLIQAGLIAETRLNQVEQAEECYALARQNSDVAQIGITDVLRLRIRSGDWDEVVTIIEEHAENAIDPSGMYFMAANVAHCMLQQSETAVRLLNSCLEHSPDHIAALLLLRKVCPESERYQVNTRLWTRLEHSTIKDWLQWENSNASDHHEQGQFEQGSIFYLERLFSRLFSVEPDVDPVELMGQHDLVDIVLLSQSAKQDLRTLLQGRTESSIGISLLAESIGERGLSGQMVSEDESDGLWALQLKAQSFERLGLLDEVVDLLYAHFSKHAGDDGDDSVYSALYLDRVLRQVTEKHGELAEVHAYLAKKLPDPSPANHFALLAAQLYSSLGKVSEATELYQQRFQNQPVMGKVFNGLKKLFIQTHNVEAMESMLGQLDGLSKLEYAEVMEEFREYAKAAEAYQQLLEIGTEQSLLSSELLPYYIRMERCYEKSGEWTAVLSTLQKERSLVKSKEFQQFIDGKIEWVLVEHLADSEIALETYEALLVDNPNDRHILKSLSRIAIQHDRVEDAITYLNQLAENPTDVRDAVEIMHTLVDAYQALGNLDKEIEVLKDIVDIDSGNVEAMDHLADCLQQSGEWNELIVLLQKRSLLGEEHERVSCHKRIARLAEERLQDTTLALKEWSRVYELMGVEHETLTRLVALAKGANDTDSYLHYADELVALTEGEEQAQLCLDIADVYSHEIMDDAKAAPYLEVALLEDATLQQAVERLESYYLLMGEWQKLLDVLLHKESKQTDPVERVETLLRASEIAETSLENTEQADSIFEAIRILEPTNAQAVRRAAERFYQNQEWMQLLEIYGANASIFKTNQRTTVEMLLRQAEASESLGQWERVIDVVQEMLEIAPTHTEALRMMSRAQIATHRFEDALQTDLQLLDTLTAQGERDALGEICLRLGNTSLKLENWPQALQYFQKTRIYLPTNAVALKGIIECSWQQQEWSKVAHLCKLLVQHATTESDVILGYLWRGFILQTRFKKEELAEQHYWRVLEYNQNNPVALFYLSGLAYQKGKWPTMAGQLQQGWMQAESIDGLNLGYALGRLLVARAQQDESIIQEVSDWFAAQEIMLEDIDLPTRYVDVLQERFFGI